MVFYEDFEIRTTGQGDILDLTEHVMGTIHRAGASDGLVVVFVPGSTAGMTTIEYEPGLVQDLKDALEILAPRQKPYHHNERWGDGNGFSHVRAALLGPSLSIPLRQGRMELGTWQQIVLVDMDNRPRSRKVIVQVLHD